MIPAGEVEVDGEQCEVDTGGIIEAPGSSFWPLPKLTDTKLPSKLSNVKECPKPPFFLVLFLPISFFSPSSVVLQHVFWIGTRYSCPECLFFSRLSVCWNPLG